jgi:hypothetical protein
MRAMAEAEVQDIALERVGMQDAVDGAKVEVSKTKKLFAEERKMDKNCKGTGQPLPAEIDCTLQSHGTDRAAHFGGALTGNNSQKSMAKPML